MGSKCMCKCKCECKCEFKHKHKHKHKHKRKRSLVVLPCYRAADNPGPRSHSSSK
jgi:hypothetical protein